MRKNILFYFNCSNCFPDPLGSSVPWLAILIAAFIFVTRRIILVPFILGLTRHAIVVDFHTVSVGQTVSTGVTNVFSVNPLGRPIRWSFWHPSFLEVVNLYGCLMELLSQVSDGYGEVCDGFDLGHHRVRVCRHCCCKIN